MNLTLVEYQPQKVLAAFRQGEFDGLEVIGQADERDFFQRCFQEHLLVRLADSMPTARKKQEVSPLVHLGGQSESQTPPGELVSGF